jgi:ribosomal protein L37AE/L43A
MEEDLIELDNFYNTEEFYLTSSCSVCNKIKILGFWQNLWICYKCQLNNKYYERE